VEPNRTCILEAYAYAAINLPTSATSDCTGLSNYDNVLLNKFSCTCPMASCMNAEVWKCESPKIVGCLTPVPPPTFPLCSSDLCPSSLQKAPESEHSGHSANPLLILGRRGQCFFSTQCPKQEDQSEIPLDRGRSSLCPRSRLDFFL